MNTQVTLDNYGDTRLAHNVQVNHRWIDLQFLHRSATLAAIQAENDFRALHGEPCYSGFAWVSVREKDSTKLGRALVKLGFRFAYGGGLQLWNPGGSYTQSMHIKETGAMAYAKVFQDAGIKAYMHSRAD